MSAGTAEIQSMFDRQAEAWKANDGAAVASFFAPEGTLMNPFGELAEGRPAIAAIYTEYFAGMLWGSSTTFRVSSARALGENHAFADCDQVILAPGGETLLQLHLSAVLQREGGAWQILDARAFAFTQPS